MKITVITFSSGPVHNIFGLGH